MKRIWCESSTWLQIDEEQFDDYLKERNQVIDAWDAKLITTHDEYMQCLYILRRRFGITEYVPDNYCMRCGKLHHNISPSLCPRCAREYQTYYWDKLTKKQKEECIEYRKKAEDRRRWYQTAKNKKKKMEETENGTDINDK